MTFLLVALATSADKAAKAYVRPPRARCACDPPAPSSLLLQTRTPGRKARSMTAAGYARPSHSDRGRQYTSSDHCEFTRANRSCFRSAWPVKAALASRSPRPVIVDARC